MRVVAVIAIAFALALGNHARADDSLIGRGFVQAKGMGTSDISKATSRSQAKILARQAAAKDARLKLRAMIDSIRVTQEFTVRDAQLQNHDVILEVQELLQNAFVVNESIVEDSGDYLAEVTLGICLTVEAGRCENRANLSQVIYHFLKRPDRTQLFTAPTNSSVGVATGVIVDARKLDIEPSFDARLVSAGGKEIYGPGQIDNDLGGDWLHWAKSVQDAAARTDVVGSQPLLVTATGIAGESGLVLNDEDAAHLFQANLANDNFLAKGKVILVIR